jgi:8-oxo-dGTP pyrophosphatase MutT (NUDIX family)
MPATVPLPPPFDLQLIRERMAAHQPVRLPAPEDPLLRAAVALIFAGPPDRLSVCFIHRATVEGDRWSGQMALPGGRGSAGDATTLDIAIRETEEEVGVKLAPSDCVGELAHVQLRRRGLDVRGILSPYVFALPGAPPPLRPNHEVKAAYWIALSHLWDPAACASLELQVEGEPMIFPGIRVEKEVIWGLTYRVLCLFAAVLGRPLPCGEY